MALVVLDHYRVAVVERVGHHTHEGRRDNGLSRVRVFRRFDLVNYFGRMYHESLDDVRTDVARRHNASRRGLHLFRIVFDEIDQKAPADTSQWRPAFPKRVLSRTRSDLLENTVEGRVCPDQMVQTLAHAPAAFGR